MSVTFIIGNGFDRQCGMKTSYKEIYEAYEKHDSPEARILCEHIKCNSENWSDFEEAIALYSETFKNHEELISCVGDFTDFIQNYVKAEEERVLASFKTIPGTKFYQSVNSFHMTLPEARRSRISRYMEPGEYCNFISLNYTKLLQKLIDSSRLTRPNSLRLHDEIKVHGDYESGAIVGAGDENQFVNNGATLSEKDKKLLIKTRLYQEVNISTIANAVTIIDNASIICIFGASLGKSDVFWRKLIIKWLKKDGNHQLVVVMNQKNTPRPSVIQKQIEREDELLTEFMKSIEIDEADFDSLRNRIHIPLGSHMFEFN